VAYLAKEKKKKRTLSSSWLDEFYSNMDNIKIEGTLTPSVSDLNTIQYYSRKGRAPHHDQASAN
jgi:hypothetical protein